tara:strand:- start:493 stop:912 length:420 start_codon:yes stop_codon:yes gene_type:complete
MGGRAAEMVVFGPAEVTQGASSDLQMVTQIAREMVTRYGFSVLGPVAYERDGGEVFLGRDWMRPENEYSGRTGKAIDQQVQQLARQALDQAERMLASRRQLLDELVVRLIEQETISGEAFRQRVEQHEAAQTVATINAG